MDRIAGILFPISSLWSNYGIGTFGKAAYEFVDFLKRCGVGIWQILPLNVTSYGNSPYQSPSNYGMNYYFIDLDILIDEKLLDKEDVTSIDWGKNTSRVDYGALFANKLNVLRKAFARYDKNNKEFLDFVEKEKNYSDFSVFMVIKDHQNLKPWYEWDEKLKKYSPQIEQTIKTKYKDEYLFYMWTQYEFLKQFFALKKYANESKIKLMGDLPIYVAFDSVEVWKYPELFELDERHYPKRVAGVPPDMFSTTGQLWGNPLYDWAYHKKSRYKWWNARINNALSLYDLIRIDHFKGFSDYYAIPFGDKTAERGVWVSGPGLDLFKDKLDLPIVAEDLGLIDAKFLKLMSDTGYPGMKIVTQAFDDDNPKSTWRPSNYTKNFFSYTATHDSATTRQFIDSLDENSKERMLNIMEKECKFFNIPFSRKFTNEELTYKMCELNFVNKAKAAIIPIMDLFALGKEARINFPSTLSDDNWSWRMDEQLFKSNEKAKTDILTRWIDNSERN